MKRKYITPDAFGVEVRQECLQVASITGNAELDLGGGGDVPGRSHEAWFSDDEWKE